MIEQLRCVDPNCSFHHYLYSIQIFLFLPRLSFSAFSLSLRSILFFLWLALSIHYPKSIRSLFESSQGLKLTTKTRLEMKDPIIIIPIDDYISKIYNKIDAKSKWRMEVKDKVIIFTKSHTKLKQSEGEMTKQYLRWLLQTIDGAVKPINNTWVVGGYSLTHEDIFYVQLMKRPMMNGSHSVLARKRQRWLWLLGKKCHHNQVQKFENNPTCSLKHKYIATQVV